MTTLTWLHPDLWWIVPAALGALVLWRFLRRRAFVAFSAVPWLARLGRRPSMLRRLPELLIVVAFVLLIVAVMDPAVPYSEAEVQSEGLDIALVLDLSSSMQELMETARPIPAGGTAQRRRPAKTRLETTKDALRDFISRRRDDRIALIVFSDFAYVVSPLTFDREGLAGYIDIVDDQILRGEGMTAIGDGIGLANYLLARQSTDTRRNKVIVVFTDGEYNFGRDPLETIDEAAAAGVRVHVIGVDLDDEAKHKPAVVGLIRAVRANGGQYYSADTTRELRASYGAIDSIEKGRLTSTTYVRNSPVFGWFVMPALVVLVMALVARAIPYFADFT